MEARSLLYYCAFRDLGVGMTSLQEKLQLSIAAIAQSVEGKWRIKEETAYQLSFSMKV